MKLIDQLSSTEKVLWYGKKAKGVSVLEAIFNPMLPFALIWALIDGAFIFGITAASQTSDVPRGMGLGLLGFFAIHLMPVWMYLGGVLTAALKAGHTDYCVTDKGVYVQQGVLSSKVIMKPYPDMMSVTFRQGFFDKIFHTGDVAISCSSEVNMPGSDVRVNGRPVKDRNELSIDNIADYQSVMQMIREHQEAAAAEYRSDAPAFRGQFTAQMASAGGMMQETAVYQQQQFARSAFGQPVSQQPMFSDPQRGFSATSGSFVADGIPQPADFNQPSGFAQPASFIRPTPAAQSFMQPTPLQQPQPAPVPQFSVPQQPKQPQSFAMPKGFDVPAGFDMPDLATPEPQPDFVDPTLSQAQNFRDPTLDYVDPNRPI